MNTPLQDRLEKLSPQQRELVLQKLRSRQTESAPENKITPIPKSHGQPIPLSFAQARLWFLYQQMDEKSAAYNVPLFLHLKGKLDHEALKAALDAVIERHAILRTQFEVFDENSEAVQVILDEVECAMSVIDLQHLPADERLTEARCFAKQEMQKPFDLQRAPLLRLHLLKLADDQHVFALVMHHIITDGWSMAILREELSVLYRAGCQQQPSPLKQLALQYADYAWWQRQWLSGKRLQQQITYWKQQLADAPSLLELPTDYPRQAVMTYNGQSTVFSVDANTTVQLRQLAQQSGCTLFMTLLAAFNVLLARYSGQNDISVGSPIANRHRHEIEPLIGFFVNTLVLRNRLDMQADFGEFLSLVKRTTLEAYAHQDMPFEKLVDELNPVRSLSHNPLFQLMFVMQNMPVKTLDLPDLQVETLDYENTTAQFDLTLAIKETSEGLKTEWEYNTNLFDASSIQRMAGHFGILLKAIVDNPQVPLNRLPLLTQAEIEQQRQWNQTTFVYSKNKTLHGLFEEQVLKTPNNQAVVFEDQALDYQTLNHKANQLAHYLRDQGVIQGELIGISIQRNFEMIIGVLAILKLGAAYVPIDPDYPYKRIDYLLDNAQARILLTQAGLLKHLANNDEIKVVCIDSEQTILENYPGDNLALSVTNTELAYIIYTSGSTGNPKGVIIDHRGAVNTLHTMNRRFNISDTDRIFAIASLSFDLSVYDIFGTLAAGACIVLPQAKTTPAPDYWAQVMREQQVTLWNSAPPLMQLLADYATAQGLHGQSVLPESLRFVWLSGDWIPVKLANQLKTLLPKVQVISLGGATEASIWSICYPIDEVPEHWSSIPYGHPLDNQTFHVLNEVLEPCPIGITGSLYIGGIGLAKGYWRSPEKTNRSFIKHPRTGELLYHTGDMGCYMVDGNIEFQGREDFQVKVRGFRIELGEIETVLRALPSVKESIVTVWENIPGNQQLVAYLTIKEKYTLVSANEIKQYLREHLPEYMIPAHFITLESLPVTVNGKLDRDALPTPKCTGHLTTKEIVAPRTTLELELLRIWETVLKVHPIGVNDNFFELGGHSLLAANLISRIEREMGRKIPITLLFQESTITQQAAFLQKSDPASNWSTLVPLKPNGSKPPFFCVHPGGGTVIWYRHLAHCFSQEQPFYGLESQGLEEGQEPFEQVEQMATHYIQVIQTVQPEGPYLIGGWCFGGAVAFEMAQQLRTQGQEVAFLGMIDTPVTFELLDEHKNDVSFFVRLLKRNVPHLPDYQKQIQHFDEEEQLKQLIEQTKLVEQLPADFELQQAKRMMNVFRGHLIAASTYQPQLYPGKTTFLQASEGDAAQGDETLGWHFVTKHNMELYWMPGNHISMVMEPNVQQLAEKLEQCFAQAIMLYKQPKPERFTVNVDKYKLIGTRNHSRKAVAIAALKKGEVIKVFDLTPQPQDYLTVQLDADLHIMDDLLASMNHSCSPSAYIDVTNRQVIATRDLKTGDEITFFYPSTEWVMVQPFECHCGSLNCCQMIKGARNMPTDVMNNYYLSPYIRQQLEAQTKK